MLKDISSSAAALYDGGWRSSDREELTIEHGLTAAEADALCDELRRIERANAMTTAQAAALWGITERRVRALLKAKRIPGAYRDMDDPNGAWKIPDGTSKPEARRPGSKPSQ